MRRVRKISVAVLLVLVVALSGCAGFSKGSLSKDELVLKAGQNLLAFGKQVESTADLYDRLLDEHAITNEEYAEFWKYFRKFQKEFPKLKAAWSLGTADLKDVDTVRELTDELLVFLLKARKKSASLQWDWEAIDRTIAQAQLVTDVKLRERIKALTGVKSGG